MTREELDFIGSMNMCDEISNEAYKKIVCHCEEQEPCEDDYIKVPKKALKYRTKGMVAYNAEWLKNHFDIERAVICGAQEPCNVFDEYGNYKYPSNVELTDPNTATSIPCNTCEHSGEINGSNCYECVKGIRDRYNPQPKTGHWIAQDIHNCHTDFKCSECGYIHDFMHLYGKPTTDYTYCPNCGAKMIEPQEVR